MESPRRINSSPLPAVENTATSPGYYSNCAIQPLDYIQANHLDFCEGNVVKYVTRWRGKGGVTDLKKARTYIDKLIAEAEAGKTGPSWY